MIVVVGLSHRYAPIEVRETLVLDPPTIPAMLRELLDEPGVGEAMLLSTCNRVELIAASSEGPLGTLDPVQRAAKASLLARAPSCGPHLHCWQAADAVRHLFRVASSLDSLVLGEPQILGQFKDAFEVARTAGAVGSTLHRVVTRALKAAKRVRTETAIGSGQVSVPTVALDLAGQIFDELGGRSVALVGSGDMAESIARLLRQAGTRLLVVGRNRARIDELSDRFQGEPLQWNQLEEALVRADVVVTSTSAPGYVVSHDLVSHARRARRGRSLFLIDVAVPRDVDPSVDALDGIFLYNIDDLSHVVADSLSTRQEEAERAEAIVAHEAEGYERWAESTQVTPTIVSLRERLGATLESELERSLRGRLKHLGDDDRDALRTMIGAALNKMLHAPSVRLKQAALSRTDDAEQLAAALRDLFSLGADSEPPFSESLGTPPSPDPPGPQSASCTEGEDPATTSSMTARTGSERAGRRAG